MTSDSNSPLRLAITDAEILRRGEMALALVDSVLWKDYLHPWLKEVESRVVEDELSQTDPADGFAVARIQQKIVDARDFLRKPYRDIEDAQAVGREEEDEFSEVGLPADEREER